VYIFKRVCEGELGILAKEDEICSSTRGGRKRQSQNHFIALQQIIKRAIMFLLYLKDYVRFVVHPKHTLLQRMLGWVFVLIGGVIGLPLLMEDFLFGTFSLSEGSIFEYYLISTATTPLFNIVMLVREVGYLLLFTCKINIKWVGRFSALFTCLNIYLFFIYLEQNYFTHLGGKEEMRLKMYTVGWMLCVCLWLKGVMYFFPFIRVFVFIYSRGNFIYSVIQDRQIIIKGGEGEDEGKIVLSNLLIIAYLLVHFTYYLSIYWTTHVLEDVGGFVSKRISGVDGGGEHSPSSSIHLTHPSLPSPNSPLQHKKTNTRRRGKGEQKSKEGGKGGRRGRKNGGGEEKDDIPG
jgi:hypothetical protein